MKNILFLFLIIFLIVSCRNDEIGSEKSKFEITVSNVTNSSVSINYKIQNVNTEKYLICSSSENFDIQNYEVKVPIQNNEGTLTIDNLSANKKYYIKGWYNSGYSNTISATTKEIIFSTVIDKNLGLNPENGNFLYLSASEIDPTKNSVYLLTRQIQQYPTEGKKIELHKIDVNGTKIWSKLIQDSNSPWTYKLQILSDNNIAVITGKSTQKATIITKVNTLTGNFIWQKEYPSIDLNGLQGDHIHGFSYQNNIMKIINGSGNIYDAEELFVDNDGNILSHKTIETNGTPYWIINAKYLDNGDIINVGKGDKIPNDGLVTYEGMINRMSFNNGFSSNIWTKYYGDYGGDDSFDNFLIKDNNIFIDGFYGGNNGYADNQHWLLKTDLTGNIIWENKLPVKQYFIYNGLDFFSDNQNNFYSLMNEMYAPTFPQYNIITLTKFDENGNFLWEWNDGVGYNTDTFIANKAFDLSNNEFLIVGDRSTNQTGLGNIRFLKIKVE